MNQSNFSKTERAAVQALKFLSQRNAQGQVRGYIRDVFSGKSLRGADGRDAGTVRGVVWTWLRSNAYIQPTSDRSRWVISQRGQTFVESLAVPPAAVVVAVQPVTTYKDTPRSRWEAHQVAVAREAAEINRQRREARRILKEQMQAVSYSL